MWIIDDPDKDLRAFSNLPTVVADLWGTSGGFGMGLSLSEPDDSSPGCFRTGFFFGLG
jgi:hypothetical protein